MKATILLNHILLLVVFTLFNGCDIVTVETVALPAPEPIRGEKPQTPVAQGTIRGFFGEHFKTLDQHIEKVQPVDSFSNIYFCGGCKNNFNQINLIRSDSDYVLAIYFMGYSLDSLPTILPAPSADGRFCEIQYYRSQDWNSTSPGHYSIISPYGKNVRITNRRGDTLTGTFEGTLTSYGGNTIKITEGEFKISIFIKKMPCLPDAAATK
jgi:hypothetical protein